jgi:hypothetical protein
MASATELIYAGIRLDVRNSNMRDVTCFLARSLYCCYVLYLRTTLLLVYVSVTHSFGFQWLVMKVHVH